MNDKTNFSLDITVDPANSFKPLPDLVAFDLCKAYPMPDGNLLLRNTRTGKRAMVRPEVYASLLRCSQFQSLDQHVANIIEGNPDMQGQQADIRSVFQTMLDSGIMISARNTCKQLKNKTETTLEDKDNSPPVVVIITWERPQALERLLESITANCNTNKILRLHVVDDSRKAENIKQNQALVKKFADGINAPLQYFGQQEQQSLLGELAKRLPEHENAIRFLADQSKWREHWTSGLARNLALLLSCGHRLVMIDDDTLCDVYDPPRPKPEITFSDDQREAEFFANEQGWAARHQALNPDPVDRHMQCLGLTFSNALDVLGQNHLQAIGFTNVSAYLTNELKMDSPVLMTECGSLGCPGTSRNTWLPDIAPAALGQMLASEQSTTLALTTRMAWIGRNHPHFSPRSNMSAMTGFDNREMLPPYLPFIRGEDRLFGNMLDYIFPTAVTLDYPWAVPHLPIPQREWREQDLDFTPGDSFPLFFMHQVSEQKSACHASSPADRMVVLANWFDDLAAAPGESLAAMYQDARLGDTSQQMQKLRRLMADAESTPSGWQDYLKNGIDQLTADMDKASREDLPVKGLPRGLEGDELIRFWKRSWSDFAAALIAWSEIRKAAAEIVDGLAGHGK
jgi:hypothetical protein